MVLTPHARRRTKVRLLGLLCLAAPAGLQGCVEGLDLLSVLTELFSPETLVASLDGSAGSHHREEGGRPPASGSFLPDLSPSQGRQERPGGERKPLGDAGSGADTGSREPDRSGADATGGGQDEERKTGGEERQEPAQADPSSAGTGVFVQKIAHLPGEDGDGGTPEPAANAPGEETSDGVITPTELERMRSPDRTIGI